MSQDNQNPEGFEEHKPSGKQGKGPSMKERLIAQRRAEAEAASKGSEPKPAAQKPAPKAAPKPAAKRPAAAPKKAAPKKTAPKAAAQDESEESSSRPARAQRAGRSGGASRRSGGRAAASRRRGGDEGDDGEESEGRARGGRRRPAKKEKNMLAPALGTLAVVAIAGIGAWQFMGGDDTEAASKPETPAETSVSGTGGNEAQAQADQDAADKAAKEQAAADKAAAEKAAAEKEASKPETVKPEDMTEAPRNRKGRQLVADVYPDHLYNPDDPEEPNLKEFEKFAKPDSLSDEEWANVNEKVATMLDPDAGAAGTRAATYLEELGRDAFPAMVNGLLDLDYGTAEGNLNGDFVQRTMMNIANGRNFSWGYGFADSPNKTEITNKRAVALAYGVWQKVVEDPSYWERYSNTEAAKREGAGGGDSAPADEPDAADDAADNLLDDLGIDD